MPARVATYAICRCIRHQRMAEAAFYPVWVMSVWSVNERFLLQVQRQGAEAVKDGSRRVIADHVLFTFPKP